MSLAPVLWVLPKTWKQKRRLGISWGVAKNGKGGWRYWVRRRGKTVNGPTRHSRDEAEADKDAALAGRPPRVRRRKRQGLLTRAQRMERGTCIDCDKPRAGGTLRCERHRRLDCKRQEKRRRRAGAVPRAVFDARARQACRKKRGSYDMGKKVATIPMDSAARCACGLLLPCYAKHSIWEYAAERSAPE